MPFAHLAYSQFSSLPSLGRGEDTQEYERASILSFQWHVAPDLVRLCIGQQRKVWLLKRALYLDNVGLDLLRTLAVLAVIVVVWAMPIADISLASVGRWSVAWIGIKLGQTAKYGLPSIWQAVEGVKHPRNDSENE